jgi:hypothetical protein
MPEVAGEGLDVEEKPAGTIAVVILSKSAFSADLRF